MNSRSIFSRRLFRFKESKKKRRPISLRCQKREGDITRCSKHNGHFFALDITDSENLSISRFTAKKGVTARGSWMKMASDPVNPVPPKVVSSSKAIQFPYHAERLVVLSTSWHLCQEG